jgi:transcriptional regulator with XRE-family HTH domain
MTLTADYQAALARNVRSHRSLRGWTLDELAARSSISRAMIVQIEGARTNPSIATICQLAESLGVSVATLLDTVSPETVRVTRASDARELWTGRKGGYARLLGGGPDGLIEIWQWHLPPKESYSAPAHAHGTFESLWVQKGRLLLTVGSEEYEGRANHLVQFAAHFPHTYACSGDTACEMLMLVQLRTTAASI